MTKIVQFVKNEKKNQQSSNFETNQRNSESFQSNHFIESNSNSMTTKKIRFQTIQIKSIKITSMRSNEMISAKSIKKKISNQRNASNDTFRIESSNLQSIKRDREKSKKIFVEINFVINLNFCFFINHANKSIDNHFNQSIVDSNCFLIENSFHLFQFIDSKQKKINDLLKKIFFEFVNERDVLSNIRVFNARFVNEIKNENTKKTYEKSRLIIQTYNDSEKNQIFIQSSIIQRMNQRLILCIVVMIKSDSIKLYFQNITQTYVQSIFIFNRNFYVKLFHEFVKIIKTSFDCILKIMKLLYEIFETNNH